MSKTHNLSTLLEFSFFAIIIASEMFLRTAIRQRNVVRRVLRGSDEGSIRSSGGVYSTYIHISYNILISIALMNDLLGLARRRPPKNPHGLISATWST